MKRKRQEVNYSDTKRHQKKPSTITAEEEKEILGEIEKLEPSYAVNTKVYVLRHTLLNKLGVSYKDIPQKRGDLLRLLLATLQKRDSQKDVVAQRVQSIPDDVWRSIFSNFHYTELFRSRRVCKRWMNIIDSSPTLWTNVIVSYSIKQHALQKILQFAGSELKVLEVKSVKAESIADECWQLLSSLSNLKRLRLPSFSHNQQLLCKIIEGISGTIEELDLDSTSYEGNWMEPNPIMESLTSCKKLRKLSLPAQCHITAQFIQSLPHLIHLDATMCSYHAPSLKAIMKQVTAFRFGWSETGDFGEAAVIGYYGKRLKFLDFAFLGKLGRAEDFRYILKNLPQLEILKIDAPFELHENGWLKIAKYGKNLKKLHVTSLFDPLTDKTMAAIAKHCKKLELLELKALNSVKKTLTNYQALANLCKELPELRHLFLNSNIPRISNLSRHYTVRVNRYYNSKDLTPFWSLPLEDESDLPPVDRAPIPEKSTEEDPAMKVYENGEFELSGDEEDSEDAE